PFYMNSAMEEDDPRKRPWAVAARRARRQTWSDTYVLFGAEGHAEAPGVTCATPVYGPDSSLLAVLDVSFELDELCTYLKALRVGFHGYAFVVEFHSDGSRNVIAHPSQEILLRTADLPGQRRVQELVPVTELADPRVAAFLKQVPPGIHPSDLRG